MKSKLKGLALGESMSDRQVYGFAESVTEGEEEWQKRIRSKQADNNMHKKGRNYVRCY